MQALKTQAEALVVQIDWLLSQEMLPLDYAKDNGSGMPDFGGLEVSEGTRGLGNEGYNVCEALEFEVGIPAMQGPSELSESYPSSVELGSPSWPYTTSRYDN